MNNLKLRTVKQEPVYEQVMDHIRQLVASGAWPPGMKLPRIAVLAEWTDTSTFTVQTALEHLSREGLFERIKKSGTFVKGTKVRLTSVGLYCGAEISSLPEAGSIQAFCRSLRERWAEAGIATRVWMDDRIVAEQTSIPAGLRRAIKRREIQALVVPVINNVDIEWLKELKIPVAMSCTARVPNRVGYDWKQMSRVGLERLHAQGCRSVGLITTLGMPKEVFPLSDAGEFSKGFSNSVRDFGLETRKEWIRTPESFPDSMEEYGFRESEALWSQKEHPEGLLVYPDTVVRGVLTSLLARRVAIPGEVKLVLHRNDSLPYACPVSATYLVTPLGEVVSGLIEMIWAQVRGETVTEKLIPFMVTDNGVT